MTDGAWRRTVHCKDFRGRDRALAVSLSDDGQLVLATPPGEAAILVPGSGGDQLKRCIDEAQLAAAALLMGRTPAAPALTGSLRDAATFYVLDRDERTQALGVGLNGLRVAFNGPRGFWQADTDIAGQIGGHVLSLVQTSRDLRRG